MTILAGTAEGLYVVAEPGGEATDGGGVDLEGREITALTPDGRWALTDGHALWRRRERWEQMAAVEDLAARCVAATDDDVWIGTSEAHLLRFADDRIEVVWSFDEAEGRADWYTPWGGPPDTRSLSASDDTLYANVHVGGILRSTDAGATWSPTIDIDADVHQVLAHPSRTGAVLAATARGLAATDDRAETWRFETEGLHAPYCRAVAVAGDAVLVSASTGPSGRRAAVYRREGDGPFVRCDDGLPEWFDGNIDTACLVASGPRAAIGTDDGDVYRSTDAGATWERAAAGLPPVRCLTLVV